MTRKRFRRPDGAPVRILLCGWLGLWLLGAVPRAASDDATRVWRVSYLMGTRARLVVETPDRTAGLRQLERMLQILEQTEHELSTWRDDSLLSQLNRHPLGHPLALSPHICELLDEIGRWQRETGGAFDPAVGTLLDRWMSDDEAPPDLSVRPVAAAGFERLARERNPCTVTRLENVRLDAGGFGKGEALDRVAHRLDEDLSGAWMVDLGGQVSVSGVPAQGSWTVAVAHPSDRTRTVVEFPLRAGSLAVSGGSERDRWVAGARVGHILDPRSGLPITRRGSVVVWHEEALAADVLSTALYVMGEDAGLAWAEARNIAVCFVTPADAVSSSVPPVTFQTSRAFRRQFVLP